jgi:sugar lactone lactonase YvrE
MRVVPLTLFSLCLLNACVPTPATTSPNGQSATPPKSQSPNPPGTSTPVPPPLAPGGEPVVSTLAADSFSLSQVAIDASDRLYVVNTNGVSRLDADGHATMVAASSNTQFDQTPLDKLDLPSMAAFGTDGTLVALGGPSRLVRIEPNGHASGVEAPGSGDPFHAGLVVDRQGNAYYSASNTLFKTPGDSYIAKVTPDGTRTVYAGQPGVGGGYMDGPAQVARFNSPGALAFDAMGNLYVADVGNLSIRRITPDGTVSTVVGHGAPKLPPSPMPGLPDLDLTPFYAGTVAVQSLAIARDGTLYYSAYDNRIHRIAADGVASVYSGDGRKPCATTMTCSDTCPTPTPVSDCHVDGPAGRAEFNGPGTVLVDSNGTVYVLDGMQGAPKRFLRKITPAVAPGAVHAGPVSVVRENPPPPAPTPATTSTPSPDFPSCPPSGGCGQIHGQVFDAGGVIVKDPLEIWASPGDRPTVTRKLGDVVNGTYTVALPGMTNAGLVLTVKGAGHGDRSRLLANRRGVYAEGEYAPPGTPTPFDFGGPPNPADPDAPAFYLPATGVHGTVTPARVTLPFEATHTTTFAHETEDGPLWHTVGLALARDGRVIGTHKDDNAVYAVAADSQPVLLAGGRYAQPYGNEQYLLDGKGAAAHFYEPKDVVLDAAGNAYIADQGNSALRKVLPDGTVTTLAGHRPYGYLDAHGTDALFWGMNAIAINSHGTIYVADSSNQCIRSVSADGTVKTFAGAKSPGYVNGPAANARFRNPVDVAIDSHDNVLVADAGNHRIRRITPDGQVSDVYGMPTNLADGTVAMPDVDEISNIAVDAHDNLYIATTFTTSRVYKVTPGGTVTIFAGYGLYGAADGPAAQAYFGQIGAMVVAPNGTLYLTDPSNGRIRTIVPD